MSIAKWITPPLTSGDFVVTWQSDVQDGDGNGIYGQRFSSIGIPQGNEFQVNTYTTSHQNRPSAAGLSTGNFVVVWQSNGQDGDVYGIYGQRYSGTGTPQGSEFQINTYTTSSQWNPSVAPLTLGDFVVTWQSGGQDGGGDGIYGQRYLSTGAPQGSEFQINTYTTSNQRYASVVTLSSGSFVVAWDSYRQNGNNYGIYGRIYYINSTPPELIKNALTINGAATVILSTSNINAYDLDVAKDSELIFTITNIRNGQFERTSNPGIAITNFTQQEIIDAGIQFVHDGSINQPAYDVSVSDGLFSDGPISANITFVYIAQNQLVVQPSEALILGYEQLDIQTKLAPIDLEISVINVQFGHFEKNDVSWIVTTLFDLSEFNAGKIRFVHDGTENKPQYILQFKDLSTNFILPRNIIGKTILNHAPELINPIGVLSTEINKEFSYTLPSNIFIDQDGQALHISVNPLKSPTFPAWIQFNNLTTTLNGKPTVADSHAFKAIASDPYGATAEDSFYINVKNNESTNPVPIVAAIAGGTALLTGGIAAGIVYFKKAQDRKTRKQNEFARRIRHHLKLGKVDNFDSEQGQRFVQAVATLSGLLQEEQGINIEDIDENRLDVLASGIAVSAKNKITPDTTNFFKKSKITISDFADNIEELARDNRLDDISYAEVSGDVSIPMHTM